MEWMQEGSRDRLPRGFSLVRVRRPVTRSPGGRLPRVWGSGNHSRLGVGTGFEEVTVAGAELAVEDGAADLEQEIGAASGPSHLLRLVRAAVDQEVGRGFGQGGADPQAGAMALGIVD